MAKAKFGTFDDLLQISEEALRPVVNALRETMFEVDQNIRTPQANHSIDDAMQE